MSSLATTATAMPTVQTTAIGNVRDSRLPGGSCSGPAGPAAGANHARNTKKRISIQQVNLQPNNSQSAIQTNHVFSQQQHQRFNEFQPDKTFNKTLPNKIKANHILYNHISSKVPQPPQSQQGHQGQFNPLANATRNNCVVFQYETDGRNTFPSQRDFHDFCKQRDIFYGIKEIWTTQHSNNLQQSVAGSNNSFDPAFGKMRALFQLNSSPVNMNRLAALFLSQCILDSVFCSNQIGKSENGLVRSRSIHQIENQKAENSVRKILQSNPSKLEQLRNRVAPNPEASEIDFVQINDPMAFLKYFIGSPASIPTFIQYLIDHAIHELSEIESTIETEGPPTDVKDVHDLIQKTILLGKMLGYLYYIPYQTKITDKLNRVSCEEQAALRSYQAPPLDLHKIILKSLKQNRVVITLPWVLELLAQGDPALSYLPNYKPTFNLISLLYHTNLIERNENKFCAIDIENRRFLRLYVENLLGSIVDHGKENMHEFGSEVEEMGKLMISSINNLETNEECLDLQSSIGATLIPICFPTFQEASSANISYNVDEFPPLSLTLPDSPFPDRITQIHQKDIATSTFNAMQELLEDQFYKMHPASMKKTVEFTSERVASKFIKSVRNHHLGTIKEKLISNSLFLEVAVISCQEQIKELGKEFCSRTCKECLSLLLDDSLSEGVKSTCWAIASRKADTRVAKWVEQHITKDLFPVTKLTETINSEDIEAAPQPEEIEQPVKNPQLDQLPFECLILLQGTIKKLHNNKPITSVTLDQLLHNVSKIYNYKPWMRNSIINLAISLLTFQPDLLTDKLLTKFINLWKLYWNAEEDPQKFVCSRNLLIFTESRRPAETLSKFGSLLKSLLENKLLSLKILDEFCFAVMRQDWPETITENISRMWSSLNLGAVCTEDGEADNINFAEWIYSGRDSEF